MTVALIIMAMAALPENTERLLYEAHAAYHQGDYAQAIETYTELQFAHDLKSPALLFNLGNAWFRSGALGRAILHYEAALSVDPDFNPARRNLDIVLEQTQRKLPMPAPRLVDERFLARYYPLTPMQSLLAAHGCIVLALILLAWRHWRPEAPRFWPERVALGIGLVLYGLTLGANAVVADAPLPAVTQLSEAPVFFSMNETDQPRFLLYEGDRVLVDRLEGDWVRVVAHGGERGWTRRDNIGIVRHAVR